MAEARALPRAILDTNVFVGASFSRGSASAALIDAVRAGRLIMIWNAATRAETERILRKIPPLSWERFADVFHAAHEAPVVENLAPVAFVTDPEDRKFAALSLAEVCPIVTSDDDLLSHSTRLDVWKPGAFLSDRALRAPS